MFRKTFALALALSAILWLACSKDNKSTAPTSGTISGSVTADGIGVPGVSIVVSPYLFTDGGQKVDNAFEQAGSAADGDFRVEVLAGRYRISFSAFITAKVSILPAILSTLPRGQR